MADDIDNVKEIIVKELKELLDKNDALKRFFVAYSLEQNRALIALWLRKDAQFVNGLFNTIEGCYDPNRSKKDREALQKEVNDILKIKDVYEKAGSLINLILTATGAESRDYSKCAMSTIKKFLKAFPPKKVKNNKNKKYAISKQELFRDVLRRNKLIKKKDTDAFIEFFISEKVDDCVELVLRKKEEASVKICDSTVDEKKRKNKENEFNRYFKALEAGLMAYCPDWEEPRSALDILAAIDFKDEKFKSFVNSSIPAKDKPRVTTLENEKNKKLVDERMSRMARGASEDA